MDENFSLPEAPRSEPVFPPSSQELPSSPPSVAASDVGGHRKPKKPPSVTPRSFRRFFTPRFMLNGLNSPGSVKTSRQALKVLSSKAVNRLGPAFVSVSKADASYTVQHEILGTPPSSNRKRKLSSSSLGSPLKQSPVRKVRVCSPVQDDRDTYIAASNVEVDHWPQCMEPEPSPTKKPLAPVSRVHRSRALRTSGNLYMRSVLGYPPDRVTLRANTGTGWQDLTSSFYSHPDDSHTCASHSGDRFALPFCTASCNTNSLVAVGDEEGSIRLLDSAKHDKMGFSAKPYLMFRPHTNAIMDLDFSSDDFLLATASGDQTALIIDMTTQKPIYCLANHTSSVKRIQFQPASNNKVLATCSRDGNVNVWDIRCKGFNKPVVQARCSLDSESEPSGASVSTNLVFPQVLNTIYGAHSLMPRPAGAVDKAEPQIFRSDITVTSLAFLPPGRENLFVTGSEASACVKLWDLRTAHSNRRGRPVLPLSTTREPESHMKYRRFGLTSIAFGGDGSRLYSLCRDGSIYAYSTSHLVLGNAHELRLNNSRSRWCGGLDKEGLGPLYGFRHPRLHVSSFYVKIAVRKSVADKPEMLATGSSDSCAIIFPTDEQFLRNPLLKPSEDSREHSPESPVSAPRSALRRTNSGLGLTSRLLHNIPIYQSGTALVQGHKKEVSAVSWTVDGELITVGDDYNARCWREGSEARDLRIAGEGEGKRWRCGWAETKDSYDDEDE